MEAERDVVRRLRTSHLQEGRGIEDEQERRPRAGVQHQREDHASVLPRNGARSLMPVSIHFCRRDSILSLLFPVAEAPT
jgi:hypothetical protein